MSPERNNDCKNPNVHGFRVRLRKATTENTTGMETKPLVKAEVPSAPQLVSDPVISNIALRIKIPEAKLTTPKRTFGLNNRTAEHRKFCQSTTEDDTSFKAEPYTESSSVLSELYEQERFELRRYLDSLKQKNLIEKFSKVELTAFDDVDDDVEDQEPPPPSTGDDNSQPKVIRTFSADDSVVELTKDPFEPKFVRDINFEVLKHPDSRQQISINASQQRSVQRKTSRSTSSRKLKLSAEPKRSLCEFPSAKRSAVAVNLGPKLAQSVSNESVVVQPAKPNSGALTEKAKSAGQLSEQPSSVRPPEPSKEPLEKLKKMAERLGAEHAKEECLTTKPAETKIRRIMVNGKCYHVLNRIGHGGSSIVYQVYQAEQQKTLALKVVDLTKSDGVILEGFRSEIKVLQRLRHCGRVVKMYDHQFRNNNKELLIVMEKGDADLANVMKSHFQSDTGGDGNRRLLSPHVIKLYWQEMLEAVREIHQENIVHADLKPVNFILVAGKLKLIDFGIAKAMSCNQTNVYNETIIGTMDYMAPESIQKQNNKVRYNKKVDIWSLGIILYNLVYGVTPFSHLEGHFQKGMAIINGDIEYRPVNDPLLLDVIKKCLQKDPTKRPTADELLRHRYLKAAADPPVKGGIPVELVNQISSLTPDSLKRLVKTITDQK